jgi:two-component system LytT family sensor kinase
MPARSWKYLVLWVLAWNAAVPIRYFGLVIDRQGERIPVDAVLWPLVLDQTSWALATYAMFFIALQGRRYPLRRVIALLALLAIPIMVIRYYVADFIGQAMGRPAMPAGRMLWYNGPFYLFLLMAAAALGLLVVYMQRERDSAVLQANLKAELANARLQTLRLQLNPHFLFNALNSIASLVRSDAPKADTAIGALSSFLRASLSVTRGEETSLENELRLVDSYLEIEVLRFEWLTVDLEVPDSLRSACVPAFVLQLLVENAIRHGLAPRNSPGRVVIAARLDGNRLQLSVSDDGVGHRAQSGNPSLGIGLQNVRARLAQLHGDEGTFTLETASPTGTVATIRIPYRVCQSEVETSAP